MSNPFGPGYGGGPNGANGAPPGLWPSSMDQLTKRQFEASQAEYIRREQTGQQAGIPGQGPPPVLIHQPGANVLLDLQSEAFETFEEYYQVLPDESWFDPNVSAQRPVQFTVGAFQVPPGMNYWMFNYNFTPFRLSGQDPGDLVHPEKIPGDRQESLAVGCRKRHRTDVQVYHVPHIDNSK